MKCYATLFGMLLLSVAALAATPALARIPEPTGRYSVARQGSLAVCLNPAKNYAAESCSASGAVVFPLSDIATGSITYLAGIGCGTDTEVFNSLPPNTVPPSLNPETVVVKVTSYESTTGIGTGSYTAYSGGSCTGANFDSTGATKEGSGTLQFVVTEDGRQVEATLTQFQSPINSLGSVSLFDSDLKQTK
jgi:hypothetical protein